VELAIPEFTEFAVVNREGKKDKELTKNKRIKIGIY